jgi:serine protease
MTRRLFAPLIAGMVLCGILSAAHAQAQRATAHAGAPRPAHGLIVKLKDAPDHKTLQSASGATLARNEQARWSRVLRDTGLKGAGLGAPSMRAVGRDAQLLRFDRTLSADEASALAQRLQSDPEVAWVVPNEMEHRLQVVTPNDPLFGSTQATGQWWLRPANGSNSNVIEDRLRGVPRLQTAWAMSTGSLGASGPVVAVLDTGITSHTDLSGRVLAGYDFVSIVDYANDGDGRDTNPSDPGDWVSAADKSGNALFADCTVENSSWHGTIIAGIVGAATNNGEGVAGVNWDGRVLPVRVAGKCGAEVADIVDGMRWAAGLTVVVNGVPIVNPTPARVVSISFGSSAACNQAYQEAVNELHAAGAVVVAAAGNEHTGVIRPASCSGVVGVAALNRDGFKASYSNFGPQVVISTVGGDDETGAWGDLLTDGGMLTLIDLGETVPTSGGYARVFGTSFAGPVVAGTVALMLSVNRNLTVDQIIAGLRASARPHVRSNVIGFCSSANPGRCICTTNTCGAGILDAPQALLYAQNPAAYVAPTLSAANIDAPEVLTAAARGQDLPANTSAVSGGGGGGGALDMRALVALLAFVGLLSISAAARSRS